MAATRKRVSVIYTGGTIGMRKHRGSYAPESGYLGEQMRSMPELQSDVMPKFDIHEVEPLLDSSNMLPSDWVAIAREIAVRYDDYDGFVVLHGTDTMTYTASALAFLLPNLAKPVVVTGSQIPLCEVRNDARENIITSLLIAGDSGIPEVCLCFGERLLRGCRAVKISADGLNAFESPNYPPLGRVGISIEVNHDLVRQPPPETDMQIPDIELASVAALRLFPGISPALMRNVLQPPLQGLILEAYGAGNGPDRDPEFLSVLREATDRGVAIVACTQCVKGAVDLSVYATGSALAQAGVIGGFDMTAEAALTKLSVFLGRGVGSGAIVELMQRNIAGELSPGRSPDA